MANETEIVIVAEMTAQPGKAEALRRAIEAAIPPMRAEEGNSVFRLHEGTGKARLKVGWPPCPAFCCATRSNSRRCR